MTRPGSSRWWLAGAFGIALAVGSTIAAERSPAAMTDAAAKWSKALTAEQRQQALFPFAGDERLRFHFIPTENFPRKGLLT
jgi:hypothetical protein